MNEKRIDESNQRQRTIKIHSMVSDTASNNKQVDQEPQGSGRDRNNETNKNTPWKKGRAC